jgi:hypothetical protein
LWVFNVGWLAAGYVFPTGESPPEFINGLRGLAKKRVNLTRGIHLCEFCSEVDRSNPDFLGNGEIWVRGRWLKTYAAPTLIVHYVEAHSYRPPDAFIAAVLRCS